MHAAGHLVFFVDEQKGGGQNGQGQEYLFQLDMDEIADKRVGRQKIIGRKEILVGAKNRRQKNSQKSVKKMSRQRAFLLPQPNRQCQWKQEQ